MNTQSHNQSDEGHTAPIAASEWDTLIARLASGEETAVETFYDSYAERLHAIASRQIDTILKGRFDPQDVVQSALGSFFRRVQSGQFSLSDGKKFWSLICAIVLTKAREKARFHTRAKRSPTQERSVGAESNALGSWSPQDAVALADEFEHFMGTLDNRERRVVELKLRDQTNTEIAKALRSSERTVSRVSSELETRLSQLLLQCANDP